MSQSFLDYLKDRIEIMFVLVFKKEGPGAMTQSVEFNEPGFISSTKLFGGVLIGLVLATSASAFADSVKSMIGKK